MPHNVLRQMAVGLPKHQLSITTNVYLKIQMFLQRRNKIHEGTTCPRDDRFCPLALTYCYR